MSWLKEKNPEEYTRLTQLREENPRALQREIGPVLQEYAKEKHPDQYKRMLTGRKHAQQMRTYARRYRKETDPEKRAVLEKEMRTTLAETFDNKQQTRKEELKKLEERISKYKETLNKNSKSRQAIIDSQLKEWTKKPQPEE